MWVYVMATDQNKRRLLNLDNGAYIDTGLHLGKPTIQIHFRSGLTEATTLAFCDNAADAAHKFTQLANKLGACDMARPDLGGVQVG